MSSTNMCTARPLVIILDCKSSDYVIWCHTWHKYQNVALGVKCGSFQGKKLSISFPQRVGTFYLRTRWWTNYKQCDNLSTLSWQTSYQNPTLADLCFRRECNCKGEGCCDILVFCLITPLYVPLKTLCWLYFWNPPFKWKSTNRAWQVQMAGRLLGITRNNSVWLRHGWQSVQRKWRTHVPLF